MQVPIGCEACAEVVKALQSDGEEVYVTELSGDKATIVVRTWVPGEGMPPSARRATCG